MTEIRIFIASPSDMTPERDRLIRIISDFNQPQRIIAQLGLRVQALDWRQHVMPKMGLAEEVILEQLPADTRNIFLLKAAGTNIPSRKKQWTCRRCILPNIR
jgi:hypothetical protein